MVVNERLGQHAATKRRLSMMLADDNKKIDAASSSRNHVDLQRNKASIEAEIRAFNMKEVQALGIRAKETSTGAFRDLIYSEHATT